MADMYDVYYFAEKNLPEGSVLKTSFNELYIYNNYFIIGEVKNWKLILI